MAMRGEGSGPTWTSLFVFVFLGFRWSLVNGSESNVQPLLYFTEEPSGTVYGAHFATLCINCSASCTVSGAVNMMWRKDDRAFVNNSQGYSISNDSLCIENLSKPIHEGFYECIAQHQIGTLVSSKVKVEEAGISSLYVEPVNVSASVGQSIRFQCVVNATPWPDIDWLKNDQKLIDNDSRVTVLKSGVLQLVNVTKEDEGQYKCLARNSWANETSLWATLYIVSADSTNYSEADVLLGRPQDQVVIVSQTVVLECFLGGRPLFPITWTKQGSEIRKDVRLFGSGNLEISNVNETDSGTYVCGWTNSRDGENKTAQANITVYVPPRLNQSQSMRPYTLKRREQVVRLHCVFSGHPVPLVTWLKDGKIVKTNSRIRVDRFELSIIQTRASDEGIYQCRAENPAGMQQTATQLQYEINVNAPYPPVGLVASSVDSTSVQLSWRDSPQNRDRAVQAFSVHIIPPAGLEHQFVVPCKRKPCSESLKVEILQPYTNYTIYVVAYNRQGRSKQSRKLAITTAEDVPTRFPSLTLFALNTTSIRLSWKELSPDQARGVITEYMIRYQKLGASRQGASISVHPPMTEYTLTGLDPNTKYNVLVAARTEVGYPLTSSDSWPWKTGTTAGFYQSDVIPTTPQMSVAVINNTALLVNWTRNTRIQVLGYNLFCRSNGSVNKARMEFHVTLSKEVSRHLIKDLEPSTVYQVKLVAFNSNGESVPVIQTVLTGSTVEVQVINSTTVILRWKRPSQTVIYEYTVRYCSLTSPVVSKSVTSFAENQIISELFPFMAYEFSVEARGSQVIHLGTAKCRTSEGVPSAPLDLDVSPHGRGSALVHWSHPVKQNGVIIKYIVFYTTDHDWTNAYWFSQVENGTSLSTVVENLKPGVMYYFRVQAVTNAGRGPSSEIAHMIATSVADTQALSDQELGIIIGTAIGVTCIIVCICVIVLHNRCRGCAVAAPIVSAEGRTANGSVAHCHCQLPSNYTAELRILHSRADDLSLFDNNHQLIENSNCDSKGGNMQNRRDLRYADQNNAQPLLRGKSERVCNSLDLDGIDYDSDPIVTLNNAINCAGSDKIKTDCESEDVIDKTASADTVLGQNSLLGGHLPSRSCEHTPDELANDEEEVTDNVKDSDCETSSQNDNYDDDDIRV